MTTANEIHALAMDANSVPAPLQSLRDWLEDSDVEVQGAAFALMTNRPNFPWTPSLDPTTRDGLARRYLERRLRNDDGGTWAHSRYEAAWELAGWVARFWFDTVPPGKPASLIGWLADVYRSGDAEVRRALVDGTLEHLFERKDIRAAFRQWKDDPELRIAYDEAKRWVAAGGTSPAVPPKPRRRRGK